MLTVTFDQSFDVTSAGDASTVETGDEVEYTVTGITSDTVDITLFECDDVINSDDNVSFLDEDADADEADRNDTDAVIVAVNDVAGAYGDYVNDAIVTDGSVTFTVDTVLDECFVPVVFDDANDDDALNLDADDAPTEDFGAGGETIAATITALDATPEYELNTFGEDHTVTAALVDADDNTVAIDGDEVRFTLSLVDNDDDTPDALTVETDGEVVNCPTGVDVDIATVTVVDGVAEYTFTQEDPDATADSFDYEYCVEAEVLDRDFNADTTDTTDTIDYVGKVFTDDEAAATDLALTPQEDFNAAGTTHTVSATLTDQFGDAVDGNVRFEVYRDLIGGTEPTEPLFSTSRTAGDDGEVSFSYTGPADTAEDTIIACVLDEGDTDCGVVFETNVEGDNSDPDVDSYTIAEEPSDDATKYWFVAAEGDTTASDVLGADTAADWVIVEGDELGDGDTDIEILSYLYAQGDVFIVGVTPTNYAGFEAALEDAEGDFTGYTLTVENYDDDETATVFTLTTS